MSTTTRSTSNRPMCARCNTRIRDFKVRDDWNKRPMHLKCWQMEQQIKLWRAMDEEEERRRTQERLEKEERQRKYREREEARRLANEAHDQLMENRYRRGGPWEGCRSDPKYQEMLFDVEMDLALAERYRELSAAFESLPYAYNW